MLDWGVRRVDVPVVGLPLKRVAIILASATRPLTLLLQLGFRDIPSIASPPPQSALLDVNLPNEEERVGEIERSYTQFRYFYEDVRIAFFLFFVTLFKSFGDFFSGCGCVALRAEGEDAKFDKTGFIKSLPEAMRRFAEQFVQTQLFEGLTMMLLHQDDGTVQMNEETRNLLQLVKKCSGMLKDGTPEAARESVEAIRRLLHPKNWKLRDVRLPAVGKPAEDEK